MIEFNLLWELKIVCCDGECGFEVSLPYKCTNRLLSLKELSGLQPILV
jgi:hypothetical protein